VSEVTDKLLELLFLGRVPRTLLRVLALIDAGHLDRDTSATHQDVEVGRLVSVEYIVGGPAEILQHAVEE